MNLHGTTDLHARSNVCVGFLFDYGLGVPSARASGASTTAEKKKERNLDSWSMNLCTLLLFLTFTLGCLISVPAALRRPQKKKSHWHFGACIVCMLSICVLMFGVLNRSITPFCAVVAAFVT